jgi:hypothetical protein
LHVDVLADLDKIQTPTLIVVPRADRFVFPDHSRELAVGIRVVAFLLHAHQTVHAALEAEIRKHLGIGVRDHDVLRALAAAPDGQIRMDSRSSRPWPAGSSPRR